MWHSYRSSGSTHWLSHSYLSNIISLAGYKDLTKADLQAIARYLKAIPAVKNKIE